MIDLHLHIIPGVDDGSQDMETSLQMARMAADSGIKIIVATPHSNQVGRFENFRSPRMDQAFRIFGNALQAEGIPLRLLRGMEIYCLEDTPRKIIDGLLHGLNGTNRFLVEFPFDAYPEWIEDRLQDLLDIGVTPLIAHPERYYCVQDYPGMVGRFLQMGCLTQVNKGSVEGSLGSRAKRTAEWLLDNDFVTCAASDAHDIRFRTTAMDTFRDLLEQQYGQEYARRLLDRNPRRILRGERVLPHGPLRRAH